MYSASFLSVPQVVNLEHNVSLRYGGSGFGAATRLGPFDALRSPWQPSRHSGGQSRPSQFACLSTLGDVRCEPVHLLPGAAL